MSSCVSPPAWEQRHLRDFVTKLVDGSHNPPAKQEAGHPMLSARNVEQGRIVFEGFRFISNEAFVIENARTRIAPGDVLLTIVGTIGRSAVVPEGIGPFALQRSVAVLAPKPDLLPKFLSYQLQSPRIQRHFEANARGTAQKGVYLKTLGETPIVVPPLGEQRDLVAEIEKQFSRLDEALAGLKRVKANLKRYKAAILKAAVEGRLVPTEANLARRESRKYADGGQLLAGMIQERQAHRTGKGKKSDAIAPKTAGLSELPIGWAWASVEELGRLQLGRQRAPKYHSGPNMRPYLRVQNVFEDRIDLSDVMEMDFSKADFERFVLHTGDILLNEGQSPELLGRPAMYRGEMPGVCFTNTLIRFQAYRCVLPEFALIVFRHYMHAGRFVDESNITTNIAHLSLGRLSTVEFPVPPLSEQHRIVAEVDRLLSIARETEAEVESNLKRAQSLRQAILSKAFMTDHGMSPI